MNDNPTAIGKKGGIYVFLIIAAIAYLIPIFWMLSTSFKPRSQVYIYPPKWIPMPLHWENYLKAWTSLPTSTFFQNSFIISCGVMLGSLLSCTLVAYGFARLRFPGRDFLFMILLSTMMLPPQVTLIPLYLFFSRLGWVNTFKPLIVPSFFTYPFGTYYVFLLRQFYMTIPGEFDEAAKIDGCGYFGIYWRIILPLSKPALIVVGIFSFIQMWNEFLLPLVYINDVEKYPLTLGLWLFQNRFGRIAIHHLMAVSTIALTPMILVFFVLQRKLIKGISLISYK